MDKSRTIVLALIAAGLMGLGTTYTLAQEAGRGGGGPAAGGQGGGQGGGRGQGGGNWADMRQRMADRVKTELGANDEDWKVLQPAIEKVTNLQMQARMGGRGGMMGRGGRGGPGGPGGGEGQAPQAAPANPISETPAAKAGAELAKVLEDKGSSNDEIKAKLQALRAAREQARQELTKAQAELRELVSLRQEATLVSMGLLD
jgi:hypothetical protein